ncbi:AGE family epimerase/isomerase [Edaphobacter paludis]|uniref:AGE family epimerase/isomerase n=1 Tax=Edaphobacter paludis TaxID=3035702 RepID=UPI0035A12E73
MTPWSTARLWLTDTALPLWSQVGFDQDRSVFHERLSLQGAPIRDMPRRLMVQARQIYSYATAERNNWMIGAGDLVARASRSMVRDYYEADGRPGWVMSVDNSGLVVDPTRDLYAHSFVLLGLAAAFESTGDDFYLVLADDTLRFMDSSMASSCGGYVSSLPNSSQSELRQNPHMHLLEALLALYVVAPKNDYRLRSKKVVSLLETRLFQPSTGILTEYFRSNWLPVEGDRGRLFEPGHHYEWIWLLSRYSQIFDCALSPCIEALRSTATIYGRSQKGGLWSAVRDDGVVIDPFIRLWPHTEAIKAGLSGKATDGYASVDRWLTILYQTFLRSAYPGGWNDLLTIDDQLLVDYIPSSSFYHLVCAFSECEDHYGSRLSSDSDPT